MAWTYTPRESSWITGTSPSLSDFQHIEDDIHTWGGDVNAASHQLTNCAAVLSPGGSGIYFAGANAGIGTSAPVGQFTISHSGAQGIEFFSTDTSSGNTGCYFQIYDRVAAVFKNMQYIAAGHYFTGGAVAIPSSALAIGVSSPAANVALHVHSAANQNLYVNDQGGSVLAIQAANDAGSANVPLEVIATTLTLTCAVGAFALAIPLLPSSNPGAGTKQLWYDPSDGNRVKFAA